MRLKNIELNNIRLSLMAALYTHRSTYNKTSCRSCGTRLMIMRNCYYCNESIGWQCMSRYIMDDRFHTHCSKNQIDKLRNDKEQGYEPFDSPKIVQQK